MQALRGDGLSVGGLGSKVTGLRMTELATAAAAAADVVTVAVRSVLLLLPLASEGWKLM